mgnify:CR=1 FL=1
MWLSLSFHSPISIMLYPSIAISRDIAFPKSFVPLIKTQFSLYYFLKATLKRTKELMTETNSLLKVRQM